MYAPYRYAYMGVCVCKPDGNCSFMELSLCGSCLRCLPHSPMRKMQPNRKITKQAAKREFISYKYYIIISRGYINIYTSWRGRQ